MLEEKVLLRKKRDFGDVLNASFGFIRQEFKVFGRMLLLYSSVPFLILSLISLLFVRRFMSQLTGMMGDPTAIQEFSQDIPAQFILAYFLFIVLYIFIYGLTYCYIIKYEGGGVDKSTISEVWNLFARKFLTLLGYSLLTLFLIFVSFMVVAFLFAILRVPLLMGIGMFAFFLFYIYAVIALSMLFIVKLQEDKGYFETVSRCFYLIKGHWWQTFGLAIVSGIISIALSAAFSLPANILGFTQQLISGGGEIPMVPLIVSSLFSAIGSLIVTPIPIIILSFQYYNLWNKKTVPRCLPK